MSANWAPPTVIRCTPGAEMQVVAVSPALVSCTPHEPPRDDATRVEADLGMNPTLSIPARIAAEEANDPIGVPTAAFDAVTKKVIEARDRIAVDVVARPRKQGANFACQLWGDALVGVEQQDPLVGGLRDGPILEIS